MHMCALAAGEALSIVKRTSNKKQINYFAQFMDLYKIAKNAGKYVADKKNKRFTQFQEVLDEIKWVGFIPCIPNSTRVAGALLLIQDLLRLIHALDYFSCKCEKYKKLQLNRDQWRQLAQFESIMRPAMVICFDSQGDRPEIAGEMVLAIILIHANYKQERFYDVVDVDRKGGWQPNKKFHELPRVRMTTDRNMSMKKNIP